ncbi:MAG: Hpt domain-containing protein [Marinilabiliaceae bacterium]|nr:Hpt domain-containing protein [Marinilabiliaceae bacterium]
MSTSKKLIDLSYLEGIAGDNESILDELINIFLDQIDEFNTGFKNYFSKKDWKKLAALAHKAKSSVLSMGLEELGNDLKELELLSLGLIDKEPSTENIKIEEQIFSKIENFKQVCEEAKKELNI